MPWRKISQCPHNFNDIIYEVADRLGLTKIEYVTEFACAEIDNFFGGIYRVLIKGYRDGQKIKYSAVIKWHPDPKMREWFRELYQREFVFYQRIVIELLEIQKCYKIIEGLKIKFPNCIFASAEYDKETIVVLGLHDEGFRTFDRFHKIDLVHASLVVKNLAKMHALSFALAKLNPKASEEIKKLCSRDVQYSDPNNVSQSMKSYYNASVNVVTDSVAKEKLKALAQDFLLVLNKCTMQEPYSVVCHADCWNNNILFKYKGMRPVDVIFIDNQMSRYASPVTDISYFLYMSTEGEFLSEYQDQLLNIYYGTLTAVLRQCNLDEKDVYPRSIFERQLKEYSVLGLIEALVSMKIITAAAEEAFKMTELRYYTEDGFSEVETETQSSFVTRVNGIVNNFLSRGYSLTALIEK